MPRTHSHSLQHSQWVERKTNTHTHVDAGTGLKSMGNCFGGSRLKCGRISQPKCRDSWRSCAWMGSRVCETRETLDRGRSTKNILSIYYKGRNLPIYEHVFAFLHNCLSSCHVKENQNSTIVSRPVTNKASCIHTSCIPCENDSISMSSH